MAIKINFVLSSIFLSSIIFHWRNEREKQKQYGGPKSEKTSQIIILRRILWRQKVQKEIVDARNLYKERKPEF
jgi:hypothetical protein